MTEKPLYTIVTRSGRGRTMETAGGTQSVRRPMTYWEVLEAIYSEIEVGGSGYDRPILLIRDGRVVYEGDLGNIAWLYVNTKRDALDKALRETRDASTRPWLGAGE